MHRPGRAGSKPSDCKTANAEQKVAGMQSFSCAVTQMVLTITAVKSVASHVLPLSTRARVTNVQNGRSVDVLVNDRGPYAGNRVMDLSERAAELLGITKSGLGQVVIRARMAQAGTSRSG